MLVFFVFLTFNAWIKVHNFDKSRRLPCWDWFSISGRIISTLHPVSPATRMADNLLDVGPPNAKRPKLNSPLSGSDGPGKLRAHSRVGPSRKARSFHSTDCPLSCCSDAMYAPSNEEASRGRAKNLLQLQRRCETMTKVLKTSMGCAN